MLLYAKGFCIASAQVNLVGSYLSCLPITIFVYRFLHFELIISQLKAVMKAVWRVHPQNVRFQNVRFQNVRFQNVWNVRFTKSQVYKTSGLQNVRFTKCQVYKTSGFQNVWLQKNIHIYMLCLWLVEIRRFCCSHVCRQSDGCVLFSILEVFLPFLTIIASNK